MTEHYAEVDALLVSILEAKHCVSVRQQLDDCVSYHITDPNAVADKPPHEQQAILQKVVEEKCAKKHNLFQRCVNDTDLQDKVIEDASKHSQCAIDRDIFNKCLEKAKDKTECDKSFAVLLKCGMQKMMDSLAGSNQK
jgi:hypothetical protein